MPYAQWAAYAVQLGYVGYNLYQMYQRYLIQVENDARNNRIRSLNETIELVVKPRRRPLQSSRTTMAQDHASTSSNQNPDQNPDSASPSNIDDNIVQPSTSHSNNQESINLENNEDLTIVCGSRSNSVSMVAEENCDVIFSNDSTSVESTDSDKGIIKDIYNECFICARSLNDSNRPVATLPFCMHPFHQTCLDGVLKWHPKCPVCDFHIFSPI